MLMRGRKPVQVEAGRAYGALVAVAFSRTSKNGTYWTFRCGSCGNDKEIRAADIVRGNQKTCGCVHVTHGATRGGQNPNATGYENYGGRGIRVCERWHDFASFRSDMGERPDGTEIDRIDNNKGYEPGNIRWATRKEQAANKETTR